MTKHSRLEWPHCTARDCPCVRTHDDSEAATEFAQAHMTEYVSAGYALCECHEDGLAARNGVTAFPCDSAMRRITTAPAAS